MSIEILFNYLSVAGLAFMSFGVFSQWLLTRKKKTVGDISVTEVIIRGIVTAILYVKIVMVKDPYLIIGQTIFLFAVIVNSSTIIYYNFKNKPTKLNT
jgi:hypothetical protein